MMTLHYTGERVLLADDVCEAVLLYAQALADTQSSDVVSIPVVAEDGTVANAEFLLGPASQLYATRAPDRLDQPDSTEAVGELSRRTRLLHPVALIVPLEPEPVAPTDPADEW